MDGLNLYKVNVDITHTYIGDLIVRLVGPDNVQVDLHRRSGRSDNNINMTYDVANTPVLEAFIGAEVKGVWSLLGFRFSSSRSWAPQSVEYRG